MSEQNDQNPVQHKRWLLIVGLSFFAGVILLWLPTLAQPRQAEPQWETLMEDDFDAFPGTWIVTDTSDADGGVYYWGTETFTYTSAITGLWSVGGGADGISLTAGTSTYVDNVDSWLIYGPVDLSQIFDAELRFDWWLDAAPGTLGGPGFLRTTQATDVPQSGDWLGWCALMDPEDLSACQGSYVSGSSSQWLSGTLSLQPYIQLAHTMTETQSIWIAFRFVSDGDGRVGRGAFLDNVVLRANSGYEIHLPLIRKEPTPTPTLTPTPSALDYLDTFDNASSGWTTHQARTDLGACFDARQHMDYKYSLWYEDGRYHVNIPLDCRADAENLHGDTRHVYPVSLAPGIKRPSARTCIGMKGSFETWDPYWSFWGIAFAVSDDLSTVYSLEVNNLGDWGIVKRENYPYPGPNHPFENETRTHIEPYIGGQRWPAETAFELNTLKVEIDTNQIKLYINGYQVHVITDMYTVNEVRSLKNVGIIGGDWEITPTQIGYDHFYVDEGCDTY